MMRWLAVIRRATPWALGAFMLITGLAKMYDAGDLLDELTILSFRLAVPDPVLLSVWLVRVAVGAEVAVGLLALSPVTQRSGLRALVVLLGVYGFYLALTLAIIGSSATCSCQTFVGPLPAWAGLIRNAVLMALAWWSAPAAAPRSGLVTAPA